MPDLQMVSQESEPWWQRPLNAVLIALAFCLLGAFCLHKIYSLDFWWHLSAGERIWRDLQVPRADTFSYTAAGNQWIDSHWLFQVLLWPVYWALDLEGLQLLTLVVLTAAFVILIRIGYEGRYAFVSVVLMTLAVLAGNERFIIRPDIFTFFLLAVYIALLESARRRRSGSVLLLLPVFHLAWVNFHGLHVLGIVLVGAYAAGEGIQRRLRLPFARQEGGFLHPRTVLVMLGLSGVMLVESLINPQGPDGALYPLTILAELREKSEFIGASIKELRSPFDEERPLPDSIYWYFVLLILSSASFLLNYRRLRLAHLLTFLPFLYLSTLANRNILAFSCVAIPICVININTAIGAFGAWWNERSWPEWGRWARLAFSLALIPVLALLIQLVVSDSYFLRDMDKRRFGFGLAPATYPVGAVNFLESSGLTGRGFNDAATGGYSIFRGRKVFLDGRWEVYGREHFERYIKAMRGGPAWEALARWYDFDYILLTHVYPDTGMLVRYLDGSRLWHPVYADEAAVVFVRDVPRKRASLRRASPSRIDLATSPIAVTHAERTHDAGPLAALQGLADRVAAAFGRTARHPDGHVALGDLFVALELLDRAKEQFLLAIAAFPDSFLAHEHLSVVYEKQGFAEQAIAECELALQIDRKRPRLLNRLAILYFRAGRGGEAEALLRRALRLNPRYAEGYSTLGAIYAHRDQYDRARALWERALELQPGLPSAVENLRMLEEQ